MYSFSKKTKMKLSKKIFIAAAAVSSVSLSSISSTAQAKPGPGDQFTNQGEINIIDVQIKNQVNENITKTVSSDNPFSVGMTAPKADVGTSEIEKGTVTFSSNVGTSDQFSVGTVSSMAAAANISATPDYNVTSVATFNIGDNTNIQQTIGQGVDISQGNLKGVGVIDGASITGNGTAGKAFSSNTGVITGNFEKTAASDGVPAKNEVTVEGIGTNADIAAKSDSTFVTSILKNTSAPGVGSDKFVSAGTASGGASGTVNTSTSASASSSEFISSFAQAY